MSLRAKIEAIIYATEEPASVDQITAALKDMVTPGDLSAPSATDGSRENGNVDGLSGKDLPGEAAAPFAESTSVDREGAETKPPPPGEFKAALKSRVKAVIAELIADYTASDRGMEIREVAGGYRMSTKPEQHDAVRAFARSLKAPIRLSLPALETLAVIAYKQPATAPEVSEIRGVDASGVLVTLLDRKLITTAGRKAVVGRPILYKTTKEFLLRFGLNDLADLPSMEEFEKLIGDGQGDLFPAAAVADATGVPDLPEDQGPEEQSSKTQNPPMPPEI